jgi:hypothetical protein
MDDYTPERTVELWILSLGLLAAALLGWLRLQFVLSAWQFLQQTGFDPGPAYQAAAGVAWGLGGLGCALALLTRRRWAPWATRLTVLLLSAWYWIDALAFSRAPDALTNWPYQLGLTLVCLAFTLLVLALDRQKRYFGGSYGSR